MSNAVLFEFDVSRTAAEPPLQFRVLLDGNVVYELDADADHVKIAIDDDGTTRTHNMVLEMSNKQPHHTSINQQQEIVEDAVITVKNITVDSINIDQIFSEKSHYQHNYNGNGNAVTDCFYGVMGCNGQVRMQFTAPVYLWLLENI
jgi:hypothetical protein